MRTFLIAALGAALLPSIAGAEIIGAEVGGEHSTLADGKARDIHKSTLGGSIEFGFGQFAAQFDLKQRYYGLADWDGTTFGMHGIYRLGSSSVGLFVGKDWIHHDRVENYGLEFASQLGQINYQASAAWLDGRHDNGYALTLDGDYALNDQFGLGAKFATVQADADLTRLGATARYEFTPGLIGSAELGLASLEDSDNEVFLTLGLKAVFGAGHGVTFGTRGLQEILPGL
ncbi:hypothetical protein [Paenirhodobacter sp.]|uniref:hypothetical protein n=1 Tax=Paenirhodobacter sp. TaxID=1965326 RepID=UPI003B40105C